MTELICANSPHSSGRRSNADRSSTRPRRAAEPNTLHASSSVGPLDTNNLRPTHSQDQAPARTRPLEEAAEGARHNIHKPGHIHKPGPRRLRRRSAFRQRRSFRPARQERAISFSFFVLLAVGHVRIHRSHSINCIRHANLGSLRISLCYGKSSSLQTGRFPPVPCIYSQRTPFCRNAPNMDDGWDPNAVPYKVP